MGVRRTQQLLGCTMVGDGSRGGEGEGERGLGVVGGRGPALPCTAPLPPARAAAMVTAAPLVSGGT